MNALPNLMRQMVCFTESSEKSSLETVWKRSGSFKKYLAGDKMNHLSITVYQGLSLLTILTPKPCP